MKQDRFNGQALIDAGRFMLRPARRSDAGLYALYASDERLARMTPDIPHPLPPGAAELLLQRVTAPDAEERVWIIDGSAQGQGEFLGLISLQPVAPGQSEVSFWVAPPLWNTGLASQALEAMVAANPLGDGSMVASVFQDNPASARVLTRAGFQHIGDSETFCVARGAMVPTWDYLLKLQGVTA